MSLLKKIYNYPWGIIARTLLLYRWRLQQCGSNTLIDKPLRMSFGHIVMGKNVYVWRNSRIEAVTVYAGSVYKPVITIADNVTIQQNLHLTCAESVKIGMNTALAANVTITDINHSYTQIDIPVEKQALEVRPVNIGEDCKIYNNVVILPGTSIGKHCIVGANSVVRGCFPDYSVLAGMPAKVIKRYDFTTQKWERQ